MPKMNPIETITTILTFALLISNFILMVSMWIDKAKTPERSQNDRIKRLENRVDDLYSSMGSSSDHIMELEKSNVVTQESILALLTHAIDGNHVDGLEKARTDLHKYLTQKGVKLE